MKKTKYRFYYGYDCDSVNGFNNGYYLEDIDRLMTEEEAFNHCKACLKSLWGKASPLEEWENGYQLITGFYDIEGNDISESQFEELCDDDAASYSYVYVTYEVTNEEN